MEPGRDSPESTQPTLAHSDTFNLIGSLVTVPVGEWIVHSGTEVPSAKGD